MSKRNNQERSGAPSPDTSAPPPAASPLDFVSPTEFVELPSKGIGYPDGHPLKGEEVIEIKFMTAKDEDILTSQTLLKKGIALERFMQNIIVGDIDTKSLLVGDRNAIVVAARASGYGNIYETSVICPACGERQEETYDISKPQIHECAWTEDNKTIRKTDSGTFIVRTPMTNFDIELRLLNGKDELELAQINTGKRKKKIAESLMTDQFKRMIVSISGYDDKQIINKYVDRMPAQDSRFLRSVYKTVCPNIRIVKDFTCNSCGHQQELEVPFGADFFWPDA